MAAAEGRTILALRSRGEGLRGQGPRNQDGMRKKHKLCSVSACHPSSSSFSPGGGTRVLRGQTRGLHGLLLVSGRTGATMPIAQLPGQGPGPAWTWRCAGALGMVDRRAAPGSPSHLVVGGLGGVVGGKELETEWQG